MVRTSLVHIYESIGKKIKTLKDRQVVFLLTGSYNRKYIGSDAIFTHTDYH